MRRIAPALLLVTTALLVSGCGAEGRGEGRELENALISSIKGQLADEAPIVELRSVTCNEQDSRRYSCTAYLGVESDVFKVRYAVTIAEDGCWKADARKVEALRAGPNSQPPKSVDNDSDLRGCLE